MSEDLKHVNDLSSRGLDHLMQPVYVFLGCRTPQAWLEAATENLECCIMSKY